jgi:tetraacyldisaccharide 4'-kinase
MLRAAVSRLLERGLDAGPAGCALEALWARTARPARPLTTPRPALCVAGATLGGSGATPVAVAMARVLAAAGATVALVGHAYRARPRRARWVRPDDPLHEVGDEALVAARELAGVAHVAVGPTRQSALDLASARADVVVLDGVLALASPRAPMRALLVVDGERPWGSGRLPPCGDLRAPVSTLLAVADHVLVLGASEEAFALPTPVPWSPVPRELRVLGAGGERAVADLAGARVGLATCLARPERLVRGLHREGVAIVAHARGADHGPAPRFPGEPSPPFDGWLATEKCALHLEKDPAWRSVPRLCLRQSLAVSGAWARGLA